MATATVYYSPRCPNCARFLDGLQRSSAARQAAVLVNVDLTPTRGVEFVPAVVTVSGQALVGTKAFEWLREFASDAALEPYPLAGQRGLAFSDLASAGQARFADAYSPFVRPDP